MSLSWPHGDCTAVLQCRRWILHEVALCLLKAELAQPRHQPGGGTHTNLPDDVRFDGVGHYRLSCSQGRCRVCQANTRTKCAKCDARLHCD